MNNIYNIEEASFVFNKFMSDVSSYNEHPSRDSYDDCLCKLSEYYMYISQNESEVDLHLKAISLCYVVSNFVKELSLNIAKELICDFNKTIRDVSLFFGLDNPSDSVQSYYKNSELVLHNFLIHNCL